MLREDFKNRKSVTPRAASLLPWLGLFVFGCGFFFFDEIGDQPRHGSATNTTRGLRLGSVGISHEPQIKGFFRSYVAVVVKGEFAALATLKVFRHENLLRCILMGF
jgi:hypothetical protein